MLAQFQARYPTGSLISELLTIYQGKFVVRVLAQVEGITRATGLAAAETLESAEDRARSRALEVMAIDQAIPQPATTLTQTSDIQELEQSLTEKTVSPLIKQKQQNFSFDNTDEISASAYSAFAPALPVEESTPATTELPGIKGKRKTSGKNSSQNLNLNSTPLEPLQPEFEDFSTTPVIQADTTDNPAIVSSNVTPFAPRSYSSQTSVGVSEPTGVATEFDTNEPIDLSDAIAQTDVELERLDWSKQKGRDHLLQKYGKRSRQQLDKDELLEFLDYLKSQPSP